MKISELAQEIILWLVNRIIEILGVATIAALFLLAIALILSVSSLGIAISCEIWDIYLKPRFNLRRKNRNAEHGGA